MSADYTQMQEPRRTALRARVQRLVRAIDSGDEAAVEAVLRLSRSRRAFAPLAFTVGAFAMLFEGLRLLLANWRLTLVQLLPAMWIWLAMYDLKAHVLHGKEFRVLEGPAVIPVFAAVVAITAAAFFLNAVFAYAIVGPRPPEIRPAVATARGRAGAILLWGSAIGSLLAFSTTIATRWGRPWFSLSLGIVVGLMMLCYVAVPARMVGIRTTRSKREKLTVTALGAALGVAVCTPPYVLGRIGILMLGSEVLLVPGIILLAFGFTLQAGATGAVRAIKMSAKLAVGEPGR